MNVIEGISLSKKYGNKKVVNAVSITCTAGQICGVLGANGAGKTTLFKMILGLLTPDEGELHIAKLSAKNSGGIIEKPALYEYLSARENLTLFAKIQGVKLSAIEIDEALKQVGLPLERNDAVSNFSLGMKQRLGIAIALLNNPSCLVLDEPFSGLDPMGIVSLRALIQELAATKNIGVLISSHIIEELQKVCSYLYVLKAGSLIAKGTVQEVLTQHSTYVIVYGKNLNNSYVTSQSIESTDSFAKFNAKFNSVNEIAKALQSSGATIDAIYPEISMNELFNTKQDESTS